MSELHRHYEQALLDLSKCDALLSCAELMKLPDNQIESFYRKLEVRRIWPGDFCFGEDTTSDSTVIKRLLEQASREPAFFDGLASRLFEEASEYRFVPPELVTWLAMVATGMIERPKPQGRELQISKKWISVFLGTSLLTNCYDLKPTRNSASEPLSGCDAVVEALSREGVYISYAYMVKTWSNFKQHWHAFSYIGRKHRLKVR